MPVEYSFSELIDKLCVLHLKIWAAESNIAKLSKESEQDNTNEIDRLCCQVVSLNQLRNRILNSIEEYAEELEQN